MALHEGRLAIPVGWLVHFGSSELGFTEVFCYMLAAGFRGDSQRFIKQLEIYLPFRHSLPAKPPTTEQIFFSAISSVSVMWRPYISARSHTCNGSRGIVEHRWEIR